ncbi:Long-chain-fatty-acid--CoA ligase 1 [Acropora cervicornis]|uniref:long-chain-fatty-acid--CoA ligase n=1 Tax=Acropora cervicornis TaxID=6130 RepID=A0AAD9V1R8_ACRCE|nr:Long-chain-fatty-acid--CoA ligase 1 [Acropora cervicornis]
MEGSNFGFKGISPDIGVALAVVSGSAFILALLHYYRHCSRQKAMVEPLPNPQSVEVEWILSDLACQMFSMISVPVYDTHGPEECIYIINHAELSTIACKGEKVSQLLKHAHSCKGLRNVIKMGSQITQEESKTAEGTPKGAIITHGNLVADISAFLWSYGQRGFELTPDDVHLSFLPLAHMYERANEFLMFVNGVRIGFFRGDPKLLLEDFRELKPTFFSAVPRLLNRIYDKVSAGVAGSKLKSWIFQKALESKENDMKRGMPSKNTVWDYLNLLGGCLRQISSAGHVGPPIPCNIVKLVDVEEMEYFAKSGQGENGTLRIIDRKKNIFKLSQSFVVAIVVPDAEVLEVWARSKGLKGDMKELCQNETVYQAIFQDLLAKGKEGELNSLEQVKKIYLHPEMFSIENGLLTPTLKAKRLLLQRTFEEEIDRLYEQAEAEKSLEKAN